MTNVKEAVQQWNAESLEAAGKALAAAGVLSSAACFSLIYDPDEVGPQGMCVFDDWADLYAAFLKTPGLVTIAFMSACTIPAGTYDFQTRTIFFGSAVGGPNLIPIELDDGVTINNLALIEAVEITSNSTATVFDLGDDNQITFFRGAAIASAAGAAPAVQFNGSGGGNPPTIALGFGARVDGTAAPTLDIPAGMLGVVITLELGTLTDGSVTGAGTLVFLHDATPNPGAGSVPPLIPAFTGTLVQQRTTLGELVNYSPAAPANWAGTAPVDVAEALDRLAAATPGA